MSELVRERGVINTGSLTRTPVSEAIINGYAYGINSKGIEYNSELYNFAPYPEINEQELRALADADYPTVFYEVTRKMLVGAIDDETLKSIANEAYSTDNFNFDDEDHNLRFITLTSGVHVVGLSDGPTAAFKDMAMQPFARWMSEMLKGEELTILLSSSGDTAPAAFDAFGPIPNINISALIPRDGVYPFQRAQMIELAEKYGLNLWEVPADFSQCNTMQINADEIFDLGAVNSANIARIIAQIPYHVASYLKAIKLEGKEIGDPVDISIPSGNFGNALSAIIARKMGVPIRNIIVATNENNTLDTLFKEGVFRLSDFVHTDSSAQDIKLPSNALRYISMILGNDAEKYKAFFKRFEDEGAAALADFGVADKSIMQNVLSTTVVASQRAKIIKDTYDKSGKRVILDPHTANAVAAIEYLGAREEGVPMIAYETAKPFKFDPATKEVLNITAPRPERFVGLEKKHAGKELIQVVDDIDLIIAIARYTKANRKTGKV